MEILFLLLGFFALCAVAGVFFGVAIPAAISTIILSPLIIAYLLLIGAVLWLSEIHFLLGFVAWCGLIALAYIRYKQQKNHNAS
ncbi:hypothetical protein [Testudinibacter aquarius]|uniref:Uncharacterized protein n=1 Tax=Testudinibacter aquarius TaxID=1524974 RepID=A0A4R3Y6M8_9PAST|nr:hypothetical protein [Testudinibacter aquarius]KAE9526069.1 hypothetical protein A1D24_03285 [Testudinibacter aquarius]TCV87262.1 hypothetical protein EDC16_105181 [Testudinibacter aquarius]TNG87526.1 hypothetical protein FHQ21_12005 [Testudinibacter aquarius]